jgi:hypothetical protein
MQPFCALRLAPLPLVTAAGDIGCSVGGGGGGDASTPVRTASCEQTACAASRESREQKGGSEWGSPNFWSSLGVLL